MRKKSVQQIVCRMLGKASNAMCQIGFFSCVIGIHLALTFSQRFSDIDRDENEKISRVAVDGFMSSKKS